MHLATTAAWSSGMLNSNEHLVYKSCGETSAELLHLFEIYKRNHKIVTVCGALVAVLCWSLMMFVGGWFCGECIHLISFRECLVRCSKLTEMRNWWNLWAASRQRDCWILYIHVYMSLSESKWIYLLNIYIYYYNRYKWSVLTSSAKGPTLHGRAEGPSQVGHCETDSAHIGLDAKMTSTPVPSPNKFVKLWSSVVAL